jgi:ketosteroid isomerase-like protein
MAPMKSMKPPFTDPRYDMIDPKVQGRGEIAVLTFNLVNYGRLPDAPESVLARWNATEVYHRVGEGWQIVHSHWSFVQPQDQSA